MQVGTNIFTFFLFAYFIHGAAITEDKVDRAFNVTLLEVVTACIVA